MSTRTLICPGPPEHEFTFEQKGRGRPPTYCEEHKGKKSAPPKRQAPEPKQQLELAVDDDNPFIKKAKGNPFIEKLAENLDEPVTTMAELAITELATVELSHPEKPKPPRNRPAVKEEIDTSPIIDTNTYNDAALPGVQIHEITRDAAGVWRCKVTVNEETFSLIRRGGWLIQKSNGGHREALPHVSAAIQARVTRLENQERHEEPQQRPERPARTLEQVADEVAPISQAADDIEELEEQPVKICEMCERPQEADEEGWIIDPEEGIDLCPECMAVLAEE